MAGGDSFDGGRTQRWLEGLGERATWRSVVDRDSGHTIHVVSDRPARVLTAELQEGLRLMTWLSRRPVTWYWWDQPWIRVLPAGTVPGREHVNGGWAVPGEPEVHVYRREEALKVMIHEAVHALGLDVRAEIVDPVRAMFEATLERRLWPHLGEAFTEFYAEWLWAIGRARSLAEARHWWERQLECSTGQAALVWSRIRGLRSAEDTNVFAYYVLKWALMHHSAEVLMSPDRSVQHWYQWWTEILPTLERAAIEITDLGSSTRLGMTCPRD
jgi:hypothetical protein